jgi:hypothetical protein
MSVIALKSDIHQRGLHVRYVPDSDITHINAILSATASSVDVDGGALAVINARCTAPRCPPRDACDAHGRQRAADSSLGR